MVAPRHPGGTLLDDRGQGTRDRSENRRAIQANRCCENRSGRGDLETVLAQPYRAGTRWGRIPTAVVEKIRSNNPVSVPPPVRRQRRCSSSAVKVTRSIAFAPDLRS